MIRLTRVRLNYAAMRKSLKGDCVELHFAVQCFMDYVVLRILAVLQNILFETCDQVETGGTYKICFTCQGTILMTMVAKKRYAAFEPAGEMAVINC